MTVGIDTSQSLEIANEVNKRLKAKIVDLIKALQQL